MRVRVRVRGRGYWIGDREYGLVGSYIKTLTWVGAVTWMVETAIPIAFTGTMAPRSHLQRRGVMKMALMVVAVVMMTERATLPFAMYVQRLEACPPLIEPTRTMPAVSSGLILAILLRPIARRGIMM